MTTWHKIASLFSLFILLGFLFLRYQPMMNLFINKSSPVVTASISPQVLSAVITNTPGTCHIRGVLPDSSCTPGAIDPRVTQGTIYQTICVKGYTATVRPPVSYTNKLKMQQIAAYGYTDTNLKDYEEDHLISLELGGAPSDPNNLWPEPGGSPNQKDRIENLCHEKVCSGEITLAEAQRQIVTDWPTACQ